MKKIDNYLDYGFIIEARTGSKRLPNKIIKLIKGKTILEHLIDRVKSQKKIKKIIIATTKLKKDNKIIRIAKKKKLLFFKGEENDLVKRVINAAKKNKLKYIIQVTSDNIFFDKDIFGTLLKKFESKHYDFVSNSLNSNFPIGSDIRIFSLNTLIRSSKFIKGKARQHTCYYFLKFPKKIKSYNLKASKEYKRPHYRLTLDFLSDFVLIKKIVEKLGNKYFSLKKIISFLDKNKNISKINSHLPNKLKIPAYNEK